MAKKKNINFYAVTLTLVTLIATAWFLKSSPSTDSSPNSGQQTSSTQPSQIAVAAPQKENQSTVTNQAKAQNGNLKKTSLPKSADAPFANVEVSADKPFEDWLLRFGYDLKAADVLVMLRSDMPSARKRRLLDFFISESDEGYTYFSSQNGLEFLETVLSEKSTDIAFAHRVGNILRWFGRNKASEMSDQYESRFSKTTSESEKIGLIAAISDAQFLKATAYDHTQPALVRRVAVENLLQEDKDSKTLKGLLDISDTQPALSAEVVTSAIHACATREEFQNVIDVFKKEGMATPNTARTVGEALATSRRSYWARGMDTSGDDFLTKTMEAYRSGIETGLRPAPFP